MSPPRLAVVGPTASGKSAVAHALAVEAGDIDIVSVDSMQVYRGMDIGTATPTAAERAAVPHHLIDIVDVDTEFTVAMFQEFLGGALEAVCAAGRRAVLVGGTGLYHRAAVDGLELAGSWPAIRERLESELASVGATALYERLRDVDPDAAERIDPANGRRIVRALEVGEGSGRRFSSFGQGLDRYPPTDVVQVGLRWERDVLAQRIEARVHTMFDMGLLDEAAAVLERGPSRTASAALGYAELFDHLRGACSLDEALHAIVANTRRFAVRQERWFRRDPRIRWVDVHDDPVAEVLPVLRAAW